MPRVAWFNPVETVWHAVKRLVSAKNASQKGNAYCEFSQVGQLSPD
jgi:hypothetical protein